MMPNKSIYRDADAAEINLYELNFARFFSIQTSENGWRRVVCELVRRAAKGTKELRLEDGTELPGEKTFPDYVVDLMDSYLAVLPDAKPHAYPAAEREQLMERHCRHTEDGGIDYDYNQDMTFLADKSLPFCLQSSFLDLLFPVCGVAGSGCGTCRKHLQAVPPSGKHNRCRRVFLSVQDGACSRQDWLCCRPYADHGHLWKLSLPVPHHGDRLACHAGLFQDGNRFC